MVEIKIGKYKLKENKAVYTSRSRVRVGRGSDEIDQLDSLAGAVTPKPPVNAKKSKALRTDGPTDRPTDTASSRVASPRLKRLFSICS